MDDIKINEKFDQICDLLHNKKLKPTFDLLDKLISECGIGEYRDQFVNLEQNYRYLIRYTIEGISDPERQKVYEHILISTLELIDHIFEFLKIKYSESFLYNRKRTFSRNSINKTKIFYDFENYFIQKKIRLLFTQNNINNKIADLEQDIENQYFNVYNIFNYFWFIDKFDDKEIGFFKSFLTNSDFPLYVKSLLITSLSLSLMRFFDESKFHLLFFAYEINEDEISQRAIIGILIAIYHYDKRMPYYNSLLSRINILMEDFRFRSYLELSILHFIRSKETEKIQQKLQDEIFPEMIKLSPNLKNKLNLESLWGDALTEDKNPEWNEILKDSPNLLGKIEELTQMQLEGADVFLSSFSVLKNFPFFNELINWFYPFTPEHPEIYRNPIAKDILEDQKFKMLIMKSSMLCNSDKYSFYFSILNIPQDYFEMVSGSLKAESDQFDELTNEQPYLLNSKKTEVIISQYIRDLYRFFKLNPYRASFEDIFSWKFDFHNKFAFIKLFKEDNIILKRIAEFNFEKNYFQDALEVFLFLNNTNEPEILQKIAFCYQKLGDYDNALNYYLKAELFDQNKIWILKKIALCYKNLKNPVKALEYYTQAELLQPDNLSIHVSIGQCQMEMKNYNAALKSYFKVEYLSPGNKKIWRPIGWCFFLNGKIEQAEKYFELLINDDPNKYDFLNMGHIQWCLGNRKTALFYYKSSIINTINFETEFLEAFEEDIVHLIHHGINPDDVPIMLDQLRYSL